MSLKDVYRRDAAAMKSGDMHASASPWSAGVCVSNAKSIPSPLSRRRANGIERMIKQGRDALTHFAWRTSRYRCQGEAELKSADVLPRSCPRGARYVLDACIDAATSDGVKDLAKSWVYQTRAPGGST